ncbi:MAG: ribbon-helix-helix protein, CopG family [Candidatus Aminicenantes bacterium]|nr:ribbon-helix-helix protein, CopG family [Candidatus Aminicenantes bacterium]
MTLEMNNIEALAKKLNLSREEIIRESLQFYLGKKIRELKTDIFKIRSKYGVFSIEDFEEKYKKGEIEEKDSWQEFQQLDHLEYKKEELEKTLATLK